MEIRGSCFCKAVSYAFTGPPVLSAYCHCTLCQRLTGCPFVHTIHTAPGSFRWTHTAGAGSSSAMGEDDSEGHNEEDALISRSLHTYTLPSKPHKTRYRCKVCGVCVAGYHSIRGRWSVWGAHLVMKEGVREMVQPTGHIFYGTRMVDVRDGLGKWEGYEGESERILEGGGGEGT
ncbi:Mss4-like protein [Cristinia sonorae]|uniref:Mss4-like protein n=1 Tax=Cristinia sonorae TaxID=1940300 RepID=A0A8K0XS36_9AGAR|nr:Mss4-like protein [Cristinia sonorae]